MERRDRIILQKVLSEIDIAQEMMGRLHTEAVQRKRNAHARGGYDGHQHR